MKSTLHQVAEAASGRRSDVPAAAPAAAFRVQRPASPTGAAPAAGQVQCAASPTAAGSVALPANPDPLVPAEAVGGSQRSLKFRRIPNTERPRPQAPPQQQAKENSSHSPPASRSRPKEQKGSLSWTLLKSRYAARLAAQSGASEDGQQEVAQEEGMSKCDNIMEPSLGGEPPLACRGEVDPRWQAAPWRCSACCAGFATEIELMEHFTSPTHVEFASALLQLVKGSGRGTQPGRQEYVQNSFPLPCSNRKGLVVGTAIREIAAWTCQVCHADLTGVEYFRHQFSERHLSLVRGRIQGLSGVVLASANDCM